MKKKASCWGLYILIISLIIQPFTVRAMDVNEWENTVSVGDSATIEISESLDIYFDTHSETDLSIVKNLVISTKTYDISYDDLEFLQKNAPQLSSLNMINCTFESKECYDAFAAHYGTSEVVYKCSEYPEPEGKITEPEKDTSINSMNTENYQANTSIEDVKEKGSLSLKLNGICILDKGNKVEAGVAYESADTNVMFRWLQYDLSNKIWTEISDWNSGNWITWNPQKKGDYWLYVEAKTSDGNVQTTVTGHHYKGAYVALSGICMLDKGTQYDMGVAYTSNDPDVKFQWKIYNLSQKKWTDLTEKVSGNWVSWRPKEAGDYWIHVEATTSFGEVVSYTMGFRFKGLEVSLNGICTIAQKNQVDMGVAYKSNDKELEFRWMVYDLAKDVWSQVSNWGKGNWASWKPSSAGAYWLYVEARTSSGDIKSQVCSYYISSAKIESFEISPGSPGWVGTNVQLRGKIKDLIGEVSKERYLIYDGRNWSEIVSSESGAEWTPQSLGSYLLCFEIYDKSGNLIQQSFQGYSVETPYVNLSGIYVRNEGDMQYAMAVASQTNDKETQYRWQYYDLAASQWHMISGWSGSNSTYWNAPKEGAYWIHVEAKLHDGTIKTYTMGYTVNGYPVDLRAMMLNANLYSSTTPYIILVNRSTHKVGVFQGYQGNWKAAQYWDCTDGKASTPTVMGVFKVGSRGYYFDSGAARCYWWTQFYGDYLFHSVLYNKNGTLQDGRLGMALSHGCVRLQIDNAKWIYDYIPSGTTVVVY